MKRLSRSLKAVCISCFVVFMFDGCMFRDPYVELSGGYEAGAISPSSPMQLYYSSTLDGRADSKWYSHARYDSESKTVEYTLSESGGEKPSLEFQSKREWREACEEKNANPVLWAPKLEDVTGFEWDDDWIIGSSQDGFFILNVKMHDIETWTDESKWRRQVAARTPLSPDDLISGRYPWHQTRPLEMYIVYLAIILAGGAIEWFRRPASHAA